MSRNVQFILAYQCIRPATGGKIHAIKETPNPTETLTLCSTPTTSEWVTGALMGAVRSDFCNICFASGVNIFLVHGQLFEA